MRYLAIIWMIFTWPALASEELKAELADSMLELRRLQIEQRETERSIVRTQRRIEEIMSTLVDASSGPTNSTKSEGADSASDEKAVSFVRSIQRCWNVGALSAEALRVVVVVGFKLSSDARPDLTSIRLVHSEGGSGTAVDGAYEAARRAIIRCGASGFDSFPMDYDPRREIEVKFNATTKEIR